MPAEAYMVLKFLGIFTILFFAVFWLSVPFAVWALKKRADESREEREALLQEIFWLRKTIETLPGSGTVARRHTVKMMGRFKGTPVEGDEDEKPKKAVLSKKAKAAAPNDIDDIDDDDDAEDAPAPAPASRAKAPAKKKSRALREKEPQISMPSKAGSLVGTDDLDDEEDEDDYDPAFQGRDGAADEEDDYADDSEDCEDESLDYVDESDDPSGKMIDLPLAGESKAKKQAQAMTQRIVVEIPEEDEISEDEEGFFIYRGKRFESLIDAMKQQQIDAQKAS